MIAYLILGGPSERVGGLGKAYLGVGTRDMTCPICVGRLVHYYFGFQLSVSKI